MLGRIVVIVLTLLAAGAAVQAQPAGPARRIGILLYDAAPPGFLLEAFRDELRGLGHVEGRGLTIQMGNASGRTGRLAALADDLVRVKVGVIVALNTPATTPRSPGTGGRSSSWRLPAGCRSSRGTRTSLRPAGSSPTGRACPRSTGAGADRVRAGRQPQDRAGARPHGSALGAADRHPSHRMRQGDVP